MIKYNITVLFLIVCMLGYYQNPKKSLEMELSQNSNIQQIESVLKNYALYWNANDMDSWGKLFTDDVDYINRKGGWWTNNEDNIRDHKKIHNMLIEMDQPKTFQLEIQKIDFLKPDMAIIQATSEWPGFKSNNPEEGNKNLKGIITCVFVKRGGHWLIKTLHNTLIENNAAAEE